MQDKSLVGGVLTIISGVLSIVGALALTAMILFFSFVLTSPDFGVRPSDIDPLRIIQVVYGIAAFGLLFLGVVEIVGGVYATKKHLWGLALAGAICGILTFMPLGIVATIFIAQAQKEFDPPAPIAAATQGITETLPQV